MKYLFILILIAWSNVTLCAQDTLYIKGEEKPLIVHVTLIKTNSLNYLKKDRGALRTIKMKNVKSIHFQKVSPPSSSTIDTIYLKEKKEPLLVYITFVKKKSLNYIRTKNGTLRTVRMENIEEIRYGYRPIPIDVIDPNFNEFRRTLSLSENETLDIEKEEFRSTLLLHSAGLFGQVQTGFNYMHRLDVASTQRMNYWLQIGGGFHEQDVSRRNAKGHYAELGGIVEVFKPKKSKHRFHIGCDINFQFADIEGFSLSSINSTPEYEERRIVLQFPVGYTFRGDNSLYLALGLEITTITNIFPAFDFKLGYAFGK